MRILILWGLVQILMGFLGMPFLSTLFGWLPQLPEPESLPWIATLTRHWNGLENNAESQFYFLRFMLGFFEGGFFPTVVMYLSIWFKATHRAKAMASFMAAMPLSLAIGAPLSQAISDNINWGGLPGWRWIYILEGIAPVLAGLVVWFCLPDRPQKAKWMPEEERLWLLGELADEHQHRTTRHQGAWKKHIGMVLLLTVFYFCQSAALYGLSTFMPSIIISQIGATEKSAAWLTALIYLVAFVGMQLNAWHSDYKHERIWHVATPMLLVGIGLFIFSRSQLPGWGMAGLAFLMAMSLYTHLPPFWSIPTMFLGSAAAASAIGFINMVGNLGGYLGPTIVGKAAVDNKDFATGLGNLSIYPFVGAAIVLAIGYLAKERGGSGQRGEGSKG